MYHVYGCTDPTAAIFDSLATALLRSTYLNGCFASKSGCTDSTSTRYVATAYSWLGFMTLTITLTLTFTLTFEPLTLTPTLIRYVAMANSEDGSCVYDVYGCAETSAFNFDSLATEIGRAHV